MSDDLKHEIQNLIDNAVRQHELRFSLYGAVLGTIAFVVEGLLELAIRGWL